MKSNTRLTKQGIPDLNYYGPRRKPVVPVEEAHDDSRGGSSPVGEAAKLAESPPDADVPRS